MGPKRKAQTIDLTEHDEYHHSLATSKDGKHEQLDAHPHPAKNARVNGQHFDFAPNGGSVLTPPLTTNHDDKIAKRRSANGGWDTARKLPSDHAQSKSSKALSDRKHIYATLRSDTSPPEPETWTDGATSELLDSSQEPDPEEGQHLRLYGRVQSKVVGVRFYKGLATPGEYILIKREPTNQYDQNAIRVDNVAGEQIGHIPRQMAAKLAPFLDARSLVVEGFLAGHVGFYEAPLDLKLLGTSDPVAAAALKTELQDAKLPVTDFNQEERDRKKQAAQQEKAAKEARKRMLKEAAKKGGTVKGGGQIQFEQSSGDFANITVSNDDSSATPSMEDIMEKTVSFDPRELGKVVDKYGAGEQVLSNLPMAEQPRDLDTKLLPYQRQGLAWMLDRENPLLPKMPSEEPTQLWKRNQDGTFTNIATTYSVRQPQLASGGILADDMGLGKTIQVLSLIAADPNRTEQPTLIVAPLSVMSNWTKQADVHFKKNKHLSTLIYHGENKKTCQKPSDFKAYDLVVTTYQTMALEWMPAGSKTKAAPVPRSHGLFSVDWRRIVLDEGHTIRRPSTKMAQAAYALLGRSRWILTGTPIVNTLRDLQSHLRFIRLTGGLEQADVFRGTLMRPLGQDKEEAKILLQALMSTICLRRMKDMSFIDLRLPELSSHKYTVAFYPQEREKYDAFAEEAKGMLINYQTRKNGKGENIYSHLLEVLLRMRQTCNHWQLCAERATALMAVLESQKKVDTRNPEHLRALRDLLQVSIDSHEECPVCLELLHNPVITPCAHTFGSECIERVIETQHRCPMCRAELADPSELVYPAVEFGDAKSAMQDGDTSQTSSKITALLDILKASRNKDATVKTVIFSQWTSFLDLIGAQLHDNGFNYCRLDGTMSASQRDAAMDSLSNEPKTTIMLASLGVCSVGLNLVAANQVILADSWWAPAIEDQAIDRVYRLGQTRPVSIFRLVMEDSIEDRVLELQAAKRKLTMTAFGDKTLRRGAEKSARFADIQRLLS